MALVLQVFNFSNIHAYNQEGDKNADEKEGDQHPTDRTGIEVLLLAGWEKMITHHYHGFYVLMN